MINPLGLKMDGRGGGVSAKRCHSVRCGGFRRRVFLGDF